MVEGLAQHLQVCFALCILDSVRVCVCVCVCVREGFNVSDVRGCCCVP